MKYANLKKGIIRMEKTAHYNFEQIHKSPVIKPEKYCPEQNDAASVFSKSGLCPFPNRGYAPFR